MGGHQRECGSVNVRVATMLALSAMALGCSDDINPFNVPATISYVDSIVVTPDAPLEPVSPLLAREVDVDRYAVAPHLPLGLMFDSLTGALAGTVNDTPQVRLCVVTAQNRWGVSNPETVTVVVRPARPAQLQVATDSQGRVMLTWESVRGARCYQVQCTDGFDSPVRVDTSCAQEWVDTSGTSEDRVPCYRVIALHPDVPGSDPSDPVCASQTLPHSMDGPTLAVMAPLLIRDSAVCDTSTILVSGRVEAPVGLSHVEATLNGGPLAVQLTASQWFVVAQGLMACVWNVLEIAGVDRVGKRTVHRIWVYGRFAPQVPPLPTVDLRLCTALGIAWPAQSGMNKVLVWRSGGRIVEPQLAVVCSTGVRCLDTGLTTATQYTYRLQLVSQCLTGSFTLRDTSAMSGEMVDSTMRCYQTNTGEYLEDLALLGNGECLVTSNGTDMYAIGLLRVDRLGRVAWSRPLHSNDRTYPGAGRSIALSTGGAYYVAGTQATSSGQKLYLAQVTSDGAKRWMRLGLVNANCEVRVSSLATGGAVAAYDANAGGIAVARYEADGDSGRTLQFAGMGAAVAATEDGFFVGAGGTSLSIRKYTARGQESSSRHLWPTAACSSYGVTAMTTASGGGCYIAGQDCIGALLCRVSPLGDTVWTRRLGGDRGEDWIDGLAMAPDGGVIAVGGSTWQNCGLWIVRVSDAGDVLWTRTHGIGALRSAAVKVDAEGAY